MAVKLSGEDLAVLKKLISTGHEFSSNLSNLEDDIDDDPDNCAMDFSRSDIEITEVLDLDDLAASSVPSTSFDKENFLQEVRKYRCLWDTSAEAYRNRIVKQNAWTTISETFNKDVEFLQRQLKNLKDSLKKCLDKRRKLTRSGAAAHSLPKCQYFEEMRFLHEKTINLPTESNVVDRVQGTDEGHSLDESIQVPGKRKLDSPSVPPPKRKQGFRTTQLEVDKAILEELASTNEALKMASEEKSESEVSLYCKSLIPIISGLPVKKQRLAFIRISQMLFDLEFSEE